jgi:predicted lactoylglutathione lyase
MIISDTIYVMLLTEPFFQTFTEKGNCRCPQSDRVLYLPISAESKDAVNEIVAKAEAAGGTIPNPATDYGFMYQHSFEDLDGHHWEFVWMDPNGVCRSIRGNNFPARYCCQIRSNKKAIH